MGPPWSCNREEEKEDLGCELKFGSSLLLLFVPYEVNPGCQIWGSQNQISNIIATIACMALSAFAVCLKPCMSYVIYHEMWLSCHVWGSQIKRIQYNCNLCGLLCRLGVFGLHALGVLHWVLYVVCFMLGLASHCFTYVVWLLVQAFRALRALHVMLCFDSLLVLSCFLVICIFIRGLDHSAVYFACVQLSACQARLLPFMPLIGDTCVQGGFLFFITQPGS